MRSTIGPVLAVLTALAAPALAVDTLATSCSYPPGTVAVTATVSVRDGTGIVSCYGTDEPQAEPAFGLLCECRPKGSVWPRCTVVVLEQPTQTTAACVLGYGGGVVVASDPKRLRGGKR